MYCSQPGLHAWHSWMLLPASSFPCALPWVRLLGVPWASGQPWAGRSELCWPSLSLLSPPPGTILALPRLWVPLGPLLLFKGDGKCWKGGGRGEGAHGWDLRKTALPLHEEGLGISPDVPFGKTKCRYRGVPAETLGSHSQRGTPSPPASLGAALRAWGGQGGCG